MLIFLGNWSLNKKLHVSNSLKIARVRVATSDFTDFAYVWWVEYGKKHPNDIPQTWVVRNQVVLGLICDE
jgi:hypothetical protein